MKQYIIDPENTFVRFVPLYDPKDYSIKMAYYEFVGGSINELSQAKIFLQKVKEFEDSKRKTKSIKTRYGYVCKILLPLNFKFDILELRRITNDFVKSIIVNETLEYFSYFQKVPSNNVSYLHIFISDREYKTNGFTEYHKRDLYQDSNGCFVSKNDKDARLTIKKGSVKRFYFVGFVSTKTTLFQFKDDQFLEFILKLKKIYYHIMKEQFIGKTKFNLWFKKERYDINASRYVKRVKSKINHLKIEFESFLNQIIEKQTRFPNHYEIVKKGYVATEKIVTTLGEKLITFFHKMNSRFKKYQYHHNQVLFNFHPFSRVDLAEASLEYLKEVFYMECEEIVKEENYDLQLS